VIGALPTEAIRDLAEAHHVCVRPVVHTVTDTITGEIRLVATPCGATLASKCGPCAQKNRILRMQQCREGWHLTEEPPEDEPDPDPDPDPDDDGDDDDPEPPDNGRRARSTKRRRDFPDLPNLPIDKRTVGAAFTTPTGKTYRPSMFVTFTLPSYGRVGPDGAPLDPSRYDYRRAALDALHFPKLVDRVWQNVRRVAGYQVQYFAVVEAQRRLAPHLHAAIRGAVPRHLLRQVAKATYHQVWWPAHETPVYTGAQLPVWVEDQGYVDPASREPLPTWNQSLDQLDADEEAEPAHTLRLGTQLDIQGIIAAEEDADRRVAYLTKYLAKSFGDSLGESDALTQRQETHLDRLNREVLFLPCSPRCWNWLRFGIQPLNAAEGMRPGACPSKAHDRLHLGCGGRRVLVSRKWTGKTLKGHQADRAEVVRQTLLAAGAEVADLDRMSASQLRPDGRPRYEWKFWNPTRSSTPLYRQVMTQSIAERLRWKSTYEAAKARASPANAPPRPPDSQPSLFAAAAVKGERSESRSDTECP
jgi:hypothetical protein